MIVNPGIRRFLGSAIQRLFNSASVSLPLTHTAIPARGDITPSFTRATTKTIENNDGYLVTLLAGEIGFPGARRVRNLLTFTEDFSNAAWTKSQLTATAGQLIETAATSVHQVFQAATKATQVGDIWIVQFEAKQEGRRYVNVAMGTPPFNSSAAMFDLQNGVVVSDTGTGNITATSDGYYLCTLITLAATTATTPNVFIQTSADGVATTYAGTNGLVAISIRKAQLEDVTAQTTQTAGEYVSVGVYDNFGTTNLFTGDVNDFNTADWTRTGLTASGNTVTFGANTDQLRSYVSGSPVNSANPIAGNTYVLQFVVSATAPINNVQFEIVDANDGVPSYSQNINVTTTPTKYTIVCVMTSAMSTYPQFWLNRGNLMTGAAGQTMTISNLRYVDVSYFHGSFVDGVECFPTDLAGNALTTMLGYLAEGARENLCLQSNALTTTWSSQGQASMLQNATGVDGGLTAWTFTEDTTNTIHRIFQGVTVSAGATVTESVYLAAGTRRYVQLAITGTNAIYVNIDTQTWTITETGGTGTYVASTLTPVGNGIYRATLTGALAGEATYYPHVASSNSATPGTVVPAFLGTGATWIASAIQLNLASFASSYIPTTTTSATRNADIESVSTSGNIAAAAGSIYLEYTPTHTPSGTIALWGTYVDASNYTAILHDATNLIFRKRIAGSNYDATIANAFVSGTTYKVAATWGAAGTAIYLDGVAGTPHANTTAAQIAATMQVGADGNSLQQPGAGTTNLRIWQRQLSSPEGVAVTA